GREAVAHRREARLARPLGHDLREQPAPARLEDDREPVDGAGAQRDAPADALVQPARHVGPRRARDLPLAEIHGPGGRAGAGVPAAGQGPAPALRAVPYEVAAWRRSLRRERSTAISLSASTGLSTRSRN